MTMDSRTGPRSATPSLSELAGSSGLELVARLADGSIRRPPMAETLLFSLLPPEEGKVRLVTTPEIARTVLKAATDPVPKKRYAAGKTARQVSLLRHFVPESVFDKSLRKQNGLPV